LKTLVENLNVATERLTATLDEFRMTAREAREAVAGVRRKAEGVLDSTRVTALLDDGRGLMADLRKRASPAELGQVIESLTTLSKRTDSLVEKLDLLVSRSREDLRDSLRYLAQATENLRDFSRLIREDPSRLLRSTEKRDRDLP